MSTATTVPSAPQTITVTGLTNLASDTNLLAGWESDEIDLAAALSAVGAANALDLHAQFSLTTGAAPTAARKIEIWAWGSIDSTMYPTNITGAVGTRTLVAPTFAQMRMLGSFDTDATQRIYAPLLPLAERWGGNLPPYFGFFIVHNTGQALTAASGKFVTYKAASA